MRQFKPLILLAIVVMAITLWQHRAGNPAAITSPVATTDGGSVAAETSHADELPAFLPVQAHDTLAAIARGGPFEHAQDGAVFGNYEGLLPKQPRGFYHEYTVETPGVHNRGARRIITGGTPPDVWYYTGDHYRSFQRFETRR